MQKTILILALVMLMAACAAPQQTVQSPTLTVTNPPELVLEPASAATAELPQAESTAAETVPQPVPTSRGDALVASDPAQVELNSGRPVLVEFFRFT